MVFLIEIDKNNLSDNVLVFCLFVFCSLFYFTFNHVPTLQTRYLTEAVFGRRVQLNQAQDEIMKKKELLEDLQPDANQNGKIERH